MPWTLICILTAILIYAIYNLMAIKFFGVPKSLSDTYYLYKNKKKWTRVLFPIMMVSMVAFLMPAWLEISAASALQFLAFLASGGILFVGTAPAFMSSNLENKVHTYSAIAAALFSLLWVILVGKMWYMILFWLILLTITAIVTKTWKTSYIYWLETVAFLSTFSSILIYLI